jgi:hypothetical protein
MRKLLLCLPWLAIALGSLGCQTTVTPFEARRYEHADHPMYSLDEQRVRARSMYAYPDSLEVMPGQSLSRQYYYR